MVSCRQFFADELKAIDKRERDYRGSSLSSHARGYASDAVDAIRVAMNRKKTVLIAPSILEEIQKSGFIDKVRK